MADGARYLVGESLDDLAEGLRPFIEATFAERLPNGPTWVQVMMEKDAVAGRPTTHHHANDIGLMLRVITEKLGTVGYPFDRRLSRQAVNWASELREVRNRYAHQVDFTPAEMYRALDSAELLLREIGADEEASRVAHRKPTVMAALSGGNAKPLPMPPPAPMPGRMREPAIHGLPPAPAAPTATHSGDQGSSPVPLTRRSLREVHEPQASARPDPPTPGGRARLTVESVTELSYAVAHARIVAVQEVRVAYDGPELRGASLEIEANCAAGSLGGPKVVLVDLAPNGTVVITAPDLLMLDPGAMLAVDTQQPGQIRATLRDANGDVIAEQANDVVVLAANQWIARELHLGLELLASFVQPQASALTPVLQAASDRLATATGRSDLDGYQSDNPERVDAMVESIWEAVRYGDIRYAEPPASWGISGQKVRTPHEVLEGRLGTCLDTTVTLAALLEQVGINSTLWLTESHIFLGYWREDATLGDPATTDIEEVINLAEMGKIGLLETTMITGGEASRSFADARRGASPFLGERRNDVLGITDIRGARENSILPLPSRTVSETGEVVVTEYRLADAAPVAPYVPGEATRSQPGRPVPPPRVAQWKNKLLDLTLRNRLINFTDRAGYALAVPGDALPRLEDMINDRQSISLLPSDGVPQIARERGIRFGRDLEPANREALLAEKRQAYLSDITAATYTNRLRALASKAKTLVEETGANNLYLAFGTLRWTFNDRELTSPLILVPVTLESVSRGQSFRIVLDEAGASTPNYCLLEKLRVSFGLEIPGLQNPAEDASGINLPEVFNAVRQSMIDAKRPFVVEESVHLAILQFAKFRLWKDLDDNWEQLLGNELVRHLAESPTEAFVESAPRPVDVDLDALATQVPVSADSSQLEAVAEAVAGRTFVLEGPPGTGKSQTITNLLARALAAGRRVLFVAEKRAALDVVKARLDAVGLGPFSLDLHDKGARPTAVREQLRKALDAQARPDVAALKAQLETSETSRGTLSRYAQRLHEPNAAGYSLYSARAHLLAAPDDVVALEVPTALASGGTEQVFDELRFTLRSLPAVSDLARPAELHPWGFIEIVNGQRVDAVAVHQAAQAFDTALTAALDGGAPGAVLARAGRPEELEAWAQIASAPRYSLDAIDYAASPTGAAEIARLRADIAALESGSAWLTSLDARIMGRDIASIHAAAVAADESSFFGRKKRRRAVLEMIAPDLVVEKATISIKHLSTLTAAVADSATRTAPVRNALLHLPAPLVDGAWNPFMPGAAEAILTALDGMASISRLLGSDRSPAGALQSDLRAYYAATTSDVPSAERIGAVAGAWRTLVTQSNTGPADGSAQDRFTSWAGDAGVIPAWDRTRGARNVVTVDPVTLNRWLDLLDHLEPLRRAGMTGARAGILAGRVDAEDASLAFDRGLAAASIAEREEATALSSFDPLAHNRAITRFTDSSEAIRGELPRAIPAGILGMRRFDAAFDGGDMGALKRQLTRQRGGDSVRTLMEKYGDLITQIAPCMLMSPESVARFFPARSGMFDIVVFDEASQIRVADAVGAMGRAASVVVVGDSKQMPPTSFAEISADPEDEQESAAMPVADEESILTECTQARVPSKWLSWHYRSQDEALIAFSNHQYYDSRLSSFPAPLRSAETMAVGPNVADAERLDHGISLVRVPGQFARSGGRGVLRTNVVEAEEIVREISLRFARSADQTPSLGVITFNVQQRDLIENMLRDAADERIGRAMDERDGLFVKNLESVQGDERDTILFSVAFSANQRGMLPLNFGPLSRAGGERRLNVAVTRARRQVVLYSSFDPVDLRAEQTSSRGIKDLKAYLELAQRGTEVRDESPLREAVNDRHREDIAAELRSHGLVVKTDVGLSDFRVDLSLASASDPSQPLVAVLLDGEGWRSRRTVADRDGLPVEVLRGLMRWPAVERVWLPAWLRERDVTVERLVSAVDAAAEAWAAGEPSHRRDAAVTPVEVDVASTSRARPSETPVVRAMTVSEPNAPTTSASGGLPRHPDVVAFDPWRPPSLGGLEVLDGLPGAISAQRVKSALLAAIEHEGPISSVRLSKLVAEAFGLSRVQGARSAAILAQLSAAYLRSADPGFVWPMGAEPRSWHVVRTSEPGEGRALEHVSLVEIANAMAVVAQLSGGIGDTEIKREALALFGGKRLTEQISARLDQALEIALATNRLVRTASGSLLAVPRES